MPEAVIILLTLIGCAQSIESWRRGVFFLVLIAVVIDPLRKLTPGAPGYLMLASFPILAAILMKLITTRHRKLGRAVPNSRLLTIAFILACVPPAMISAFYGPNSWMLTIFGLVSYSTLIASVYVGYNFVRKISDLRNLLATYCILSSIVLTGALIEYFEIWGDSALVGTEALGWDWIRFVGDYRLEMIAGFYRSPDVMGWHAATVTMLTLLLAITGRGAGRWIWPVIGIVGIIALLLCGRRKMVYMLPLFLTFAPMLYILSGGKRVSNTLATLFIVPLAAMWLIGGWVASQSNFVRYYTETHQQAAEQVEAQGFSSVVSTYRQSGFFGGGLGAATPGSHHLDVARPRAWQESGTSRMMFELGVPGVLALLALLFAVLKSSWRAICYQQRRNPEKALYPIAALAIFLANLASLGVSGQILADPFVAFFLSFLIGVVLSFAPAPFQPGVRARERQVPHRPYATSSAARTRAGRFGGPGIRSYKGRHLHG